MSISGWTWFFLTRRYRLFSFLLYLVLDSFGCGDDGADCSYSKKIFQVSENEQLMALANTNVDFPGMFGNSCFSRSLTMIGCNYFLPY